MYRKTPGTIYEALKASLKAFKWIVKGHCQKMQGKNLENFGSRQAPSGACRSRAREGGAKKMELCRYRAISWTILDGSEIKKTLVWGGGSFI